MKSDNIFLLVVYILAFLAFFFYLGEPDVHDAIIEALLRKGNTND